MPQSMNKDAKSEGHQDAQDGIAGKRHLQLMKT